MTWFNINYVERGCSDSKYTLVQQKDIMTSGCFGVMTVIREPRYILRRGKKVRLLVSIQKLRQKRL